MGGRDACSQRDQSGGASRETAHSVDHTQADYLGYLPADLPEAHQYRAGRSCRGGGAASPHRRRRAGYPQHLDRLPRDRGILQDGGPGVREEEPGLKLETLSSQLREMEQKITASIPTDTGPDLFDIVRNITISLADANLLPPNPPKVMSLLKSKAFHLVVVEYNTWKGQSPDGGRTSGAGE
jgi:hypothetical protein